MGDINVQTLISYTSFNDESGESPDRLVNFKRWLWAIVEKMTPLEKQDLVYFWTGRASSCQSGDMMDRIMMEYHHKYPKCP